MLERKCVFTNPAVRVIASFRVDHPCIILSFGDNSAFIIKVKTSYAQCLTVVTTLQHTVNIISSFTVITLRPRAAAMCAAVHPSLLAWFSRAAGSARVPEGSGVTVGSPWGGRQRRRRSVSTCPERTAAWRAVQPSCRETKERMNLTDVNTTSDWSQLFPITDILQLHVLMKVSQIVMFIGYYFLHEYII